MIVDVLVLLVGNGVAFQVDVDGRYFFVEIDVEEVCVSRFAWSIDKSVARCVGGATYAGVVASDSLVATGHGFEVSVRYRVFDCVGDYLSVRVNATRAQPRGGAFVFTLDGEDDRTRLVYASAGDCVDEVVSEVLSRCLVLPIVDEREVVRVRVLQVTGVDARGFNVTEATAVAHQPFVLVAYGLY